MAETDAGPAAWPPTQWTLVRRAPDDAAALEELCALYWRPAYFFFRRSGRAIEDAKDLTQEFFARMLERNGLSRVDPSRGTLRAFLAASLRNFLRDEWDKARAQKRGGDARRLDTAEADFARSPDGSPEDAFHRSWARDVVAEAFREVREELSRRGRRAEVLRHYLAGAKAPSYAELARELGVPETDVANDLHLARALLRDALERRLRPGVTSREELAAELRDVARFVR